MANWLIIKQNSEDDKIYLYKCSSKEDGAKKVRKLMESELKEANDEGRYIDYNFLRNYEETLDNLFDDAIGTFVYDWCHTNYWLKNLDEESTYDD